MYRVQAIIHHTKNMYPYIYSETLLPKSVSFISQETHLSNTHQLKRESRGLPSRHFHFHQGIVLDQISLDLGKVSDPCGRRTCCPGHEHTWGRNKVVIVEDTSEEVILVGHAKIRTIMKSGRSHSRSYVH